MGKRGTGSLSLEVQSPCLKIIIITLKLCAKNGLVISYTPAFSNNKTLLIFNNQPRIIKILRLYLIDEPTTELHPIDLENFLVLLNRMVDLGNTVIVVEHNQQVIKASDWIIDLGLEGGINGGRVIAAGTLHEIIADKNSVTGRFLNR